MNYETINVTAGDPVSHIQIYRPEHANAINQQLIEECHLALDALARDSKVVVVRGLPEVFCSGADFAEIAEHSGRGVDGPDPARLYDLWSKLATGPFCSVAHVEGKVNAGGVGFVAACDVVVADQSVEFSLSELLFGLFPACVLPFLIRRIGTARAKYFTLLTRSISCVRAQEWGLVDEVGANSAELLRLHLLRLRRLDKLGVKAFKSYMNTVTPLDLVEVRNAALSANREMFNDPQTLLGIRRFVESGRFPWD